MPGPPPKPKDQRRNRSAPRAGEWVDLEPLKRPVLPRYQQGFTVSARMWHAWRADPVTSQYGPADIAAIVELAATWRDRSFVDRDRMMDKLALTPAGKRNLRWRTPAEVKTIAEQDSTAVRKLRIVAEG